MSRFWCLNISWDVSYENGFAVQIFDMHPLKVVQWKMLDALYINKRSWTVKCGCFNPAHNCMEVLLAIIFSKSEERQRQRFSFHQMPIESSWPEFAQRRKDYFKLMENAGNITSEKSSLQNFPRTLPDKKFPGKSFVISQLTSGNVFRFDLRFSAHCTSTAEWSHRDNNQHRWDASPNAIDVAELRCRFELMRCTLLRHFSRLRRSRCPGGISSSFGCETSADSEPQADSETKTDVPKVCERLWKK